MDNKDENEGTGFYLQDMKRRRWRMWLRLLGGVAVGILVVGYFLGNFRDSGWARLTRGDGEPTAPAADGAVPEPEPGVAVVQIRMDEPGQLWVDSQTVGRDAVQLLRLPPGQHKITAQQKDAMLVQQLQTQAGEVYRVDIGKAIVTRRLLSLSPQPGK